jgi:integrase
MLVGRRVSMILVGITVGGGGGELNRRSQPYFKDKTFYEITGVCLGHFIDTLVWRSGPRKGEQLSPSRIRNVLIPLRAIWDDACVENHWELKISDPFTYVKKKHLIPIQHKAPASRDGFRFDEWIKIIEGIDPYYRPVAELMMLTGMIGSEVAGLRKKDVKGKKIVIKNSIVRGEEKEMLKTKYRERSIPITTAIRQILDYAISCNNSKYVFLMKGGKTFNIDTFRKNAWTTAIRKAGIKYRVPYSIRHTYAAWSLAIGMHPNKLVSRMGHGSKQMIYEVYGKYVEGTEEDADNIRAYFGNDF